MDFSKIEMESLSDGLSVRLSVRWKHGEEKFQWQIIYHCKALIT